MNPATINLLGLTISTLAAVLMYYYPPRGLAQYTDLGEPHFTWVGNKAPGGESLARRHYVMSKVAPASLAIGFGLQLWASWLQS